MDKKRGHTSTKELINTDKRLASGIILLLVVYILFGISFLLNYILPNSISMYINLILGLFIFLSAVLFSIWGSLSYYKTHKENYKKRAQLVLSLGILAGIINLMALFFILRQFA